MTIQEVLQTCDRLKPNAYTEEDKIRWLSQLDGIIKQEILDAFSEQEGVSFTGYTVDSDPETELLVPAPYDEVYLKYLFSQIDFHNAEYARYNNSASAFNAAYLQFANAYNRTHTPKLSHFHPL